MEKEICPTKGFKAKWNAAMESLPPLKPAVQIRPAAT
jgi:hypothetical protein